MQAFFFINGYCTNFNKPAKKFVIKSIKTLAIPAIFFTLVNRIVLSLVFCNTLDDVCRQLFHGVGFWFLWTLLFCRIIFYIMERYIKSIWIKGILLLLMLICGFMSHLQGIPDYLYHQLTLCLCIFLFLGNQAKQHNTINNTLIQTGGVFLAVILIITFFKVPYSIISGTINVGSLKELPGYLIIALSGTYFSLLVSKLLPHIPIIINAGKNSLGIYGFHFVILCLLVDMTAKILPSETLYTNIYAKMAVYITLCTATYIISLALYLLLDRYDWFRKVTGKV